MKIYIETTRPIPSCECACIKTSTDMSIPTKYLYQLDGNPTPLFEALGLEAPPDGLARERVDGETVIIIEDTKDLPAVQQVPFSEPVVFAGHAAILKLQPKSNFKNFSVNIEVYNIAGLLEVLDLIRSADAKTRENLSALTRDLEPETFLLEEDQDHYGEFLVVREEKPTTPGYRKFVGYVNSKE